MKKIKIVFFLAVLFLATISQAQQLTKGSSEYYEALRISYQTKIDWVQNNPEEHELAIESGWYEMANANVQLMIQYKGLAETFSNGIYLISNNHSINTEPLPGGGTCTESAPFCADYVYDFPCGTDEDPGETGPEYGCLGSEPNPAWYYMMIENPGDIIMSLSADMDIDFIIWGPFTEPTCDYSELSGSNIIDCSFSSTNNETPEIGLGSSGGPTTATTGEYYMFLITNYSNQEQNFVLSQTGGNGTSSQSLVIFNDISEAISSSKVNIFPNPAYRSFQISGLTGIDSELIIYDVTGSLVKKVNTNLDQITVDVSNLSSGVYQVNLTQGDIKSNHKLIVK